MTKFGRTNPELKNTVQHCVQRSYIELQSYWITHVVRTDRNAFTPISKAWLSLSRFPQNSLLHSKFLCTCTLQNFIQIGCDVQEIQAKNNLCH